MTAKKSGPTGSTGISVITDAIKDCADSKGLASYILIKKHVLKHHPSWPKMVFKSSLRRSVQKGRVKQIRNSYKVIAEPVKTTKVEKKLSKGRSKSVNVTVKEGPLEELFPHIFTWVCEPKEASYGLIRKYIGKHFTKLSADTGLRKAMETMVAKGQLDQITGKGASGTFQLVDGAKKSGTLYEDPVEDAIIASNEPKDASVPALRHYLSEYHTEYGVKDKPKVLRRALDKAEAMGWIVRVTGKGFSGTFRLSYPYIPSPKDLWREEFNENNYQPKKSRKTHDSSEEEESEDESEDAVSSSDEYESEEEVVPKKKKRAAPKPRSGAGTPKPKKPAAAKKASKKKQPKKTATVKKGKKKTPKKTKRH